MRTTDKKSMVEYFHTFLFVLFDNKPLSCSEKRTGKPPGNPDSPQHPLIRLRRNNPTARKKIGKSIKKEKSKMKTAKKLTALLIVLTLLFALSAPVYAYTGTVTAVFIMPDSYVDSSGVTQNIAPMEFTANQYYVHDTTNHTYTYTLPNINLSQIAVAANQHAPSTPTLFDVIYHAAVTVRGETSVAFDYGYNSNPWTGDPGYYINRISGLQTITVDSNDSLIIGNSFWEGYSWALYCVNGSGAPTSSDLVSVYASNQAAMNGQTIYMIFEYSYQSW